MTQTDPPFQTGVTFHDDDSDLEWQVAEVRREYRMVIRPSGGADDESDVEESYFPESVLRGKLDRGELQPGPAPTEPDDDGEAESEEGNGDSDPSEEKSTTDSDTQTEAEAESEADSESAEES
jgi:hypothetical protein